MQAEKKYNDVNPLQENIQDNGYKIFPEANIKTNRLKIGGILLIFAGMLAIFNGIFLFTLNLSDPSITALIQTFEQMQGQTHQQALELLQTSLIICGIVEWVLAIFTILGGIAALKKKMKNIALIGGFLGVFTIGPIFFISTILSIIALALIMTSKNEFQESISEENSFEK